MEATSIPLHALTAEDRQAWEGLASRALVPNPFFEPTFVLAAARELGSGEELLLVARSGADWRACLPVATGVRTPRVPLRHAASWISIYSFLGTPLFDHGDLAAALDVCLETLRSETRAGALKLAVLGAAGPVTDALAEPIVEQQWERAALHRRDDAGYLDETVSSRHRKELRRTWRKLEEEEEEVGELTVRDAAGDPAAVDTFLALERSGWKGRTGTALGSDEAHARFFQEVAARYAANGRLQLLLLENSDGRAVAAKCNIRAGDGIFCFKIAYDETLARHSPGIHLEVENMSWFHDHTDAGWMDSCATPDNAMINRLWPDRRSLVTLVVPTAGMHGRLTRKTVGLTRSARRVRNQVRRIAR